MQDFIEALTCERKNRALPEEFDYFGKLVGSWQIDYVEGNGSRTIKGEWHFSRVLEGMAIQDVIILPDYEYGTTLRIFNPHTRAWDVAYGYAGKIIRLEARKQGEMIVLTCTGDENRKWVFVRIDDKKFQWQNVTVQTNGDWLINAEIVADRIR